MMIDDYDGLDVVDPSGQRIGTVERSYVDEHGRARFLEIKLRGLRTKHRLVPADDLEQKENLLTVPFARDIVERSPDASPAGDTLIGSLLDDARAYYAENPGQGTGVPTETAGETDEEGQEDTAEIQSPASRTETLAPAAVPASDSETDASASEHEEGIGDRLRNVVERVRESLPGAGSDTHDESEAGYGDVERRPVGDLERDRIDGGQGARPVPSP